MKLPSGLYSLLKVALLTFFGAFFGALTLSGLPSTLNEWKAVFAPALGAAIAAEVGFLRTTSAAALAGTPVPSVPASVVAAAVKIAGSVLMIAMLSGCISSAPIVPVTPANAAQVSSCESSAAVHNDFVIGGFALGGISAGLGSAGAVVTDSGQQKALAIGAAIAGGLTLIDSAIVGFSAQNFANGNCTAVVGALPVTPLGDTTVTVTAPGGGK